MAYQMDMSNEPQPKRRKLLEEGWRAFKVISCEPSVSKSGNDMFIVEIEDVETQYVETIYPIATQGKRWFLKQLLSACGLDAGKDGVYEWDAKDIVGKEISCLNEHEDQTWINREGETVESKRNKIVEIRKIETLDFGSEENPQ